MRYKPFLLFTLATITVLIAIYGIVTRININPARSSGEVIDNFKGVKVYYNGGVNQTFGRNRSFDNYNIGMRYQCVEFIKRYYYERFGHKMPDSYGHAKDFFDLTLQDGKLNTKRNLLQFQNGSTNKPEPEDIIVFSPWIFNRYGHVAIISKVESDNIEIVQQNPGPFGDSRETYILSHMDNRWKIEHERVLGWLHIVKTDKVH